MATPQKLQCRRAVDVGDGCSNTDVKIMAHSLDGVIPYFKQHFIKYKRW